MPTREETGSYALKISLQLIVKAQRSKLAARSIGEAVVVGQRPFSIAVSDEFYSSVDLVVRGQANAAQKART
jgi:hypothetical protein